MSEKYTDLHGAALLNHIVATNDEIRFVDPRKVVIDRVRNHRDEETVYEKTHPYMTGLMESIHIQGIIPGLEPIICENPDNSLEALIGHCRLTACLHLGLERVKCRVLRGLTNEQKLMIIFNSTEQAPGEIGEYKQVRELTALGMSRLAIAQKLGWKTARKTWNTNKVQGYCELLALPLEIQEEWKEQQRDSKSTKRKMKDLVISKDIRHLYEAMVKDRATHPLGNGPLLMGEIQKLKDEGTTTKAAQSKKAFTATGLKGLGDGATNLKFKEFLYGIAGVEGCNNGPLFRVIDDTMNAVHPNPKPATVEDVFNPLDEIINRLGEKLQAATSEALAIATADEPVADEPVADEPVADLDQQIQDVVASEPTADEPIVHYVKNRRKSKVS